jgi:uncharacterized Zn finger protein (UPF0148 family)
MLSYFCPKCGGKNLYQFQKPKFCSHCGSSFSIEASSISNIKSNKFEVNIAKPNLNKSNTVEEVENEADYITDYSSMRGLDVNIEKYNQNDGIKLADLVSDEPVQKQGLGVKKSIKQKRGRKKIAKSLPASFISEAKMSGRNYQNDNDINIVDNEE